MPASSRTGEPPGHDEPPHRRDRKRRLRPSRGDRYGRSGVPQGILTWDGAARRCPSPGRSHPEPAGTACPRTSRTRSSRRPLGRADAHSPSSHRSAGRRRWAWSRSPPSRSRDRRCGRRCSRPHSGRMLTGQRSFCGTPVHSVEREGQRRRRPSMMTLTRVRARASHPASGTLDSAPSSRMTSVASTSART